MTSFTCTAAHVGRLRDSRIWATAGSEDGTLLELSVCADALAVRNRITTIILLRIRDSGFQHSNGVLLLRERAHERKFLLNPPDYKKRIVDRRVPAVLDGDLCPRFVVADLFPQLSDGEQVVIIDR